MACKVVDIKLIRKEGPMVIFDLSDGSCVMYDLANHVTIGKMGKPVGSLNSQLCGATLESCKGKFEDKGFYEYLARLVNAGDRSAYTISAILKRVVSNQAIEGYVRIGLRADRNVTVPVSKLPKEMIDFFRRKKYDITDRLIRAWMANRNIYQSMLSQREFLDGRLFDDVFWYLLHNASQYQSSAYGAGYESSYDLIELVNKYMCDPAALIRYLVMVVGREALVIHSAVNMLRDYHRMQTKMTDGHVSYDKYPRYLMSVHQIVMRNFNRLCSNRFDNEKFAATYDERLETKIGDYVFICPSKVEQIKNEAVQQQHCVISYIDNVLEGSCHIILMRHKREPEKAVLTIELIDNRVNHVTGLFNRDPSPEEKGVIALYESYLAKNKKPVGLMAS